MEIERAIEKSLREVEFDKNLYPAVIFLNVENFFKLCSSPEVKVIPVKKGTGLFIRTLIFNGLPVEVNPTLDSNEIVVGTMEKPVKSPNLCLLVEEKLIEIENRA